MGSCLCICMDCYCAGPELLGAHPCEIYGCCAGHAGGLGGVGIETVCGDDADAIVFPRGVAGRSG